MEYISINVCDEQVLHQSPISVAKRRITIDRADRSRSFGQLFQSLRTGPCHLRQTHDHLSIKRLLAPERLLAYCRDVLEKEKEKITKQKVVVTPVDQTNQPNRLPVSTSIR